MSWRVGRGVSLGVKGATMLAGPAKHVAAHICLFKVWFQVVLAMQEEPHPRACMRRDPRPAWCPRACWSFNPRACMRRDGQLCLEVPPCVMFQSTRPQRRDRGNTSSCAAFARFNPRARKGATWASGAHAGLFYLFQSTRPQRRDLPTSRRRRRRFRVSIHAPAKARRCHAAVDCHELMFQSTRLHETRPSHPRTPTPQGRFQSTRLHETRHGMVGAPAR